MDKFIFTILNIVFFVPMFLLIFWLYGKRVYKAMKLVIAGFIFSIIGYVITDYFSTVWGTWAYYLPHSLGIIVMGKSVVEVLVWAILFATGMALSVSYFAEKEDKKKPFW